MDDAGRARQIDAINELAERNMRAIRESTEARVKNHAEVMGMLTELHQALFGNGKVETGLLWRMSKVEDSDIGSERLVRALLVMVAVDTLLTVILAAILAAHLL